MTASDMRPPIPVTCADRPTVSGIVVPWINTLFPDGRVDFRMPRRARYKLALDQRLCQTCGQRLPHASIVFGGPNQLRENHFDEPPLCPPCGVYASKACPMVAGRQDRYATQATVSERLAGTCPDGPDCQCGGHSTALTTQLDGPRAAGGDPAHPWYALHARTGAWNITAHDATVTCTAAMAHKPGCRKTHQTLVYNGIRLAEPPRRITLVSAPGAGRVWRTLDPDEVATLAPWAAA